jgi:hypothetical protein
MRNRFDLLAKLIGQDALGRSGTTMVNDPINPETQYADLHHDPDPARQAERDRLGLLGRIAGSFCLIEIYSEAPGGEEFRACLMKHLAMWQDRARKARSDKKRSEPAGALVPSFLWIIAAGKPVSLIDKLKLDAASGWPTGVYQFGEDILRVGIIVASELPREPTTLLIRLMAAGPLLAAAAEEVAALPPDAVERVVAEPILIYFEQALRQRSDQTSHEQEFLMTMYKTWEQRKAEGWAEGQAAGRAEGRAEGFAEANADALLTVLGARGIAVSDAARARILAQKDPDQLKRWLQKAVVATTIEDVINGAG